MREADSDPYFLNEEIEYVFLNASIDKTNILATCTNQTKSAKEPTKKLVKQILYQHIKKENGYAVYKNARFDEQESVQGNFLLKTAPIFALLVVPEEVMPDMEESQVKKNIKRKRYPCVVNVLKESVGATTIIKRILDLEVNLTMSKLLAFALAVEKQFTKAIFEDEAVQF